jgi:molybdopterin synthase sulfur carrier subunit
VANIELSAEQPVSTATSVAVRVRYFAAAGEAAAREEEDLSVPFNSSRAATATVGDLRALLVERYGDAMARVLASGSFLVDGVVSRDDDRHLGARVDVLPPFAGG